ncbi:hypothetical protein [Archaeoglobus profundus]|uniref:Uncharacterized protein n=1 Tax=Archaeoglobus profundus (strain DSM 5631 / JCM 9629 / NBRC 100127 / Av18) TaxID=572546 RepID=D2RF35_ARCPA|nr:hypothetical protein [Archaeoglobus profundus]ADB58729.1 hypothetical protein Arcpr_1683 [Archaeoglobus profundus DSM 5631]
MSKGKKSSVNTGLIADLKLWEKQKHYPLLKGRFEGHTIEDLIRKIEEVLKKKIG